MINGLSVLAIIPARGGSKGLRGKNLLPLAGKSLLSWTADAALCSNYVDRVILTSDNADIIAEGRKLGVEVPFVRPAYLSTDTVPAIQAVLHAISVLPHYDLVVKLQPTSPLRTSQDIDRALDLLLSLNAESVVSVCAVKHHPNWLKRKKADGYLAPYEDGALISNRQGLPPVYALNGAVFAGYTDSVVSNCGFHSPITVPYEMPAERSLDVDSRFDFELCEYLLGVGARNR